MFKISTMNWKWQTDFCSLQRNKEFKITSKKPQIQVHTFHFHDERWPVKGVDRECRGIILEGEDVAFDSSTHKSWIYFTVIVGIQLIISSFN